jgi:Flp pilus assembly CpaF family ATPase
VEIWVYNHYTDQRDVLKIDRSDISIGRDEGNDVVLRSPFVSRRQARLYFDGGSFFLESLGLNETLVANKLVEHHGKKKIGYGDEIRVGEFSVYMMEPAARRIGGVGIVATPRKRVIELEQKLHAELLDKLNLRVTGQRGGVTDEQHVGLIKRNLVDIINAHREEVAPEMGEYLLREFLWRSTVAEIARRATGKMMYSYGFEGTDVLVPRHEETISRLVGDILGRFALRMRPHTLKEDVAAVEKEWGDQMAKTAPKVTPELREYIVRRMLSKEIEDVVLGYGPLQDLLEMPNINEIMVVGRDRIYIEKDGMVQNTGRSFFSDEIVQSIIERIITPVGRRIDRSVPLVDARLPDGSRVNAIINPLSLSGPVLTIRKFARIPFTVDDLLERGTFTEQVGNFLRACVLGRKNLIITGGTASGKTTTLNVLGNFIPAEERIITVEDSAELQLPQEHVVRLETRPSNIEGKGAYTIRDLVKNSLRMRPDRLIVGECRGPEALDMLQAMNTGHDGSMTTIHANSPEDTIMRLETMVLMAVEMPVRAIREQIAAALHIVVQMVRLPTGHRRLTHVSEIVGIDPETTRVMVEDIFVLRGRDGKDRLRHTGYIPTFAEELMARGFLSVEVFS